MREIALVSAFALIASAESNLIEIYKNASFIHQNFTNQKSEFSLNLPDFVELEDIDVASSCELVSLNLNEAKPAENEAYAKFKQNEKELGELNDKLNALNSKNAFLNNFPAFKEQSVANLDADGDKFYEAVLKNLAQISQTKKQIDELKKKMGAIEVKNFQKLDLKFECDPKQVKISYPVGVSVNLKNKISAQVEKGKVEILQNLTLTNPLDTDLSNLTIALYPFYYSSNLTPEPFYPWYEGKAEPMLAAAPVAMEAYDRAAVAPMKKAKQVSRNYAKETEASNVQNELANTWRIDNVSLKAGEEKSFSYDKQSLDAKFDLVIDGYGGVNAYVRAKFKPERSVESSDAEFKIGDINIGKRYVGYAAGEEIEEFFGKNELVTVKKENNGEFTKESFFGSKNKISQGYKFIVKNGSKLAWDVVLEERVPVSAHESVSVSMKNDPKESELDKEGRVTWKFALKPNESKEINFAYELTKPSE
nr:DUF4139 domain-containing protein [uncultured Campylobacter sp.]